MALNRYKKPLPIISMEVRGLVKSSASWYEPPYKIRAGDIIAIADYESFVQLVGISGQSNLGFNGFVLRTEYNADDNTLRIDLGSPDISFETLMARLGVSGGLA
jgi:hypothetical protein